VPFHAKTGETLFLASNCHSYNDREAYIKELARYTTVESRGRCLPNGPLISPDDDMLKEMAKFKFIIAFENSCCEDYISEKLMNAFRAGVPVVGGPLDYPSYEPTNHSLINARHFPSAEVTSTN